MLEVFLLTLEQVGVLLIFIGLGYFFRRCHQLPDSSGHVLSLLNTLLFAPAYSIANFSVNFTRDVVGEKLVIFGFGMIALVGTITLGRLLGKWMGRSDMEKRSLMYAFTFSNSGYFGYPVIDGVFGGETLANYMVFNLPINIACNSYGYMLFQKDKRFSPIRLLATPLVLSAFIGMGLGLSGIQLPSVLKTALDGAGSCMSPCAMLLAGFMLGKFPLSKLFSGWRAYLFSLVRILGISAILGSLFWLCGVRGELLFCLLLYTSMPLGLNLVVFPESCGYEKEAGDNAQMCFVSYLMALILLPVVFALVSHICL